MKPVILIALAISALTAGCSVRSERVVEPSATTTTQRTTTVSEPAPLSPAAATTTTTTTRTR
jgi:hypothetical protein